MIWDCHKKGRNHWINTGIRSENVEGKRQGELSWISQWCLRIRGFLVRGQEKEDTGGQRKMFRNRKNSTQATKKT